MSAADIGLEQAKADLAAAEATADRWRARLADVDRHHAELEATMGARALADPDGAEEVAQELFLARDNRRVAEEAIRAADRAVEVARRAERAAQAVVLRERAEAKRLELADLEARTAPLLEQLREMQGCTYAPATSTASTADGGYVSATASTRSDRLRAELLVLIGKAEIIERRLAGENVPAAFDADPAVLGRTAEESRATRERAAAEAATAPKAGLADRARALVTG